MSTTTSKKNVRTKSRWSFYDTFGTHLPVLYFSLTFFFTKFLFPFYMQCNKFRQCWRLLSALLLNAIACYYYNKNNTHLKLFSPSDTGDPLEPKWYISRQKHKWFVFILICWSFFIPFFFSFCLTDLCLMRYGHFSKKSSWHQKYNCYEIQTLVFVR